VEFIAFFFVGFFFLALVVGPLLRIEDRPEFLRPDRKVRNMTTAPPPS
jgi:hypothetical protein